MSDTKVPEVPEEQRKTAAVVNKLLDEHAAVAAGLTAEDTKKFREGDPEVQASGFPLPDFERDQTQARKDREESAKQVAKAKEEALKEDEKLAKARRENSK